VGRGAAGARRESLAPVRQPGGTGEPPVRQQGGLGEPPVRQQGGLGEPSAPSDPPSLAEPCPLEGEVSASSARERLDVWVVALCRELGVPITREGVKRWVDAGRVRVDGALPEASYRLRAGQRVTVLPTADGTPSQAMPQPEIEVSVVFEDEHLLVVDKPAGQVVHPARGHWDGTLVNGLLGRVGAVSPSAVDGRDPAGALRPGIVHRIDKDTSGLLVVAKHAVAREALQRSFAAHDIEREYLALTLGVPTPGIIDTLHGRDPRSRLRFTSLVTEGRRAVTEVRVLESYGDAALVACRLHTGRTHQIRVHLSERAGAGLLADAVYKAPRRAPAKEARPPSADDVAVRLGRQALHAHLLGFAHPVTGASLWFCSPLPADLRRAVRELRARGVTRSSTSRAPST
jgi:23S rRNA pseudouridine1911/1915/1917 synthase